MSAEFVAVQVDPDTYGRSGDIIKHVEGVKKQYDTKEKLEFYAQVMGDGTDNIHFGKWGGVDSSQPGAYGRASEQMSDWMFALGRELVPHRTHATDFTYVDLGSGTGAAAIRLTEMHPFISKVSCLNLCDEQNDLARKRAADLHLGERIDVLTGTYEEAPFSENQFDLSFSQDAFVHAFSKLKAFSEAFRITKPQGAFIFCDLMCGDGRDVSEEELATFAATNMVNDWLSPEQNVAACEQAGWLDVTFINLTDDIRISFQLMLRKVEHIIEQGGDGIDSVLLTTYKENLASRITQVDRGVFKWGVVHGKKPMEPIF